ncbi:leucine-rich repeat domain-containing protein [Psychroserpens sp.]|uniref:leucine-rich repeat domain-containing protein n=1 Tax=Psychroserpens sp. TaxID=2020870 RepID=UPI00385A0FF2
MKKQLLILTALIISMIGYSQTVGDTFTDNFISYEITSISPNTVEAIDYNTAGGNVVTIPDTVPHNTNIYSVTSIGFEAFRLNQLISVTISGNVNTIKNSAFSDNNNMTNATIQNGVVDIWNSAFFNCGLTSITIPDSVTSIGNQAFDYNDINSLSLGSGLNTIGNAAFRHNQLTSVTIPNSVTNIDINVFQDNPLTSVTSLASIPPTIVTGTNDTFSNNRNSIALNIPFNTMGAYVTDAGALWTGFNPITEANPAVGDTFIDNFITYEVTSITPNTVMIRDYDMNGGSEVIIPTTVNYNATTFDVTIIHTNSFISNPITSVIIPNSIVQIRSGAFFNNQFTSVVIPSSVTSIGAQAFAGNNFLTCVVSEAIIPPTITTGGNPDTFGEGGFGTRSNINLVVPNGTTDEYVTDSGALWTGFKMVYEVIPSTTTLEVTDYDSSNGTTVTIPATITTLTDVYAVTEIGDAAFFDKGLTNINLPNSVTSIGISAFNTNNLTTVTIPDSVTNVGSQAFVTNDLTNITLGSNVSIIGIGAFADNDLTSVTFPENVTNIGAVAFAANPLTSVTSLATVPPSITTGTNDTFHISGDRSNINLTIPNGTENDYIAAQWINFASVTLNISDFEFANSVKITSTSNQIKVISPTHLKLENYTIYNVLGAKVATGNDSTIATSTYEKGIYIIKLDFDRGIITKKILIN